MYYTITYFRRDDLLGFKNDIEWHNAVSERLSPISNVLQLIL